MGNWLCCDACTKYFPDENVMALHNSHTHNKVVKVDQGLDDPSQMDDLDGDTTIKLVRNSLNQIKVAVEISSTAMMMILKLHYGGEQNTQPYNYKVKFIS